MIRHTKSQRIGGEVALALPEADCKTVWLTMVCRALLEAQLVSSLPPWPSFWDALPLRSQSSDERVLYDSMACHEGSPSWLWSDGGGDIREAFKKRLLACAHDYVEHRRVAIHKFKEPQGRRHEYINSAADRVYSAFDKLHVEHQDISTKTWYEPKYRELTKYRKLCDELVELVACEPNARVIVFSQSNATVQAIRALVGRLPGWTSGARLARECAAMIL